MSNEIMLGYQVLGLYLPWNASNNDHKACRVHPETPSSKTRPKTMASHTLDSEGPYIKYLRFAVMSRTNQ